MTASKLSAAKLAMMLVNVLVVVPQHLEQTLLVVPLLLLILCSYLNGDSVLASDRLLASNHIIWCYIACKSPDLVTCL